MEAAQIAASHESDGGRGDGIASCCFRGGYRDVEVFERVLLDTLCQSLQRSCVVNRINDVSSVESVLD
jgi:hypothetical protein